MSRCLEGPTPPDCPVLPFLTMAARITVRHGETGTTYYKCGTLVKFGEAKNALVRALKSGDYRHESRATLAEKNALAVGDITESEVVRLIRRCEGTSTPAPLMTGTRRSPFTLFGPKSTGRAGT